MREHEFRELLEKHLNGSISEEEKSILEEFSNKVSSVNKDLPFKNESDKKDVQDSLWEEIKVQSNLKKGKTSTWRLIAASAAIFIGMALGYNYINTTPAPSYIIPDNAITLELEDGSLQIIEENGTVKVTDKTGAILGRQNGNQLVYSENSGVEKIVFNTLTVPFGRKFELKLSDGTMATLNSGSSLKYPVKFLEGQDRTVFISGEAYLNVAKDSAHPFIVNAGKLNVQVLGTQFNISSYPEDATTEVVLVEGSVSMSSSLSDNDGQNKILLEPGFKGSFDRIDGEMDKNQVVTDMYTSWMNGELIFRDMTFENIIKRLERHYNVSIVNKNKVLSLKKFNANFGNQPIEKVLEELKFNYGLDFEIIDDNQIVIE
ncbi:FecR family protein [uncultured Maribacter sp.]|uniref:FecR family protein n=1 Tax=uncultured Maribacter sp. TaxID=431308 RepID=UPI0030ECC21E|tara:strand:- start:34716 stop:35837 length:1122 start_codon:yes stop_codon:yes gene_type:complete